MPLPLTEMTARSLRTEVLDPLAVLANELSIDQAADPRLRRLLVIVTRLAVHIRDNCCGQEAGAPGAAPNSERKRHD